MHALTINERDVAGLHELLDLAGAEPAMALPWPFLHRLRELIGCDTLTFCGMVSVERRHYVVQEVDGDEEFEDPCLDAAAEDEAFWANYWSSLPCSYPDTSHDYTSVTRISDFYSTRQWHATGMYVDYLGPLGIEHELMATLPDGAGRSLRLLCFRGPGADFGERERFLLELLRPHVAEAYHAAMQRRSGAETLTPRQREILELVRTGCTNRQIARRIDVSEGTVRTHLNNIFTRLEVTSRTAAASRLA